MSQPASPSLRLTRRGRLVVTTTVVVALVAGLALLSSFGSQARPDEDGVGAPAAGVTLPNTSALAPPLPEPAATPAGTPTAPAEPQPVPESAVSQSGSGSLAVVAGSTQPAETKGRVVVYRVSIEEGLTVDGRQVDGQQVADVVDAVLTDERGWEPIDGVRFARTDGDVADVDVVIASPDTTDAMCAPLGTDGWLSCFNGSATVLNAQRWFAGVESYGDDLLNYRRYLVSHEMGHYLGYQHVDCPGPGEIAPVMVQQTKSLYGCEKGPWPSGV